MDESSDYIFEKIGFRLIGHLSYRINLAIWWHPQDCITVIVLQLGSRSLLKAVKSYYLKSISKEGQLWARDIGPLQDYLENHFQEVHLSFSHFRDIPPGLAWIQLKRKLKSETSTLKIPTVEELAGMQKALRGKKQHRQDLEQLSSMTAHQSNNLLSNYMKGSRSILEREINTLEGQMEEHIQRLTLYTNLQKEYQQKGAAACFTFSVHSNTQMVDTPGMIQDSLNSVCRELKDLHRYQISQKLSGGRLNIYISQATEPILVWLEEWLGGALSPKHLERVEKYFHQFHKDATKQTMVIPKEDIVISDHVKDTQKLVAGRVVSTIMQRMDNTESLNSKLKDIAVDNMPVNLGYFMDETKVTENPAIFPLTQFLHAYVSGTTGSGKSYTARIICEEAASYKDLNILILDPRNQAVGLKVPEDREKILSLYPEFRLKTNWRRSYNFEYFAPGTNFTTSLPNDAARLGYGRNIVSFKWQNDKHRCETFRQILDGVFQDYSRQESEHLRLLIIIEEAQSFTKKRVADYAKSAAEQAEIILDRIVREGRKYGICVFIVSQAIKDFSRDTASTRQNTNTKFFLHNTDREIDYAADFIGDGRQIVHLPPASAIVYNPSWGVAKVRFRPPFSKVWDFGQEDTCTIVTGNHRPTPILSRESQALLDIIQKLYQDSGEKINLTFLARESGITSKRKLQQIITALETAGCIKTTKIAARGNPRLIEPVSPKGMD